MMNTSNWRIPALFLIAFIALSNRCIFLEMLLKEEPPPYTLQESFIPANEAEIPGATVERDAVAPHLDLERPVYVKFQVRGDFWDGISEDSDEYGRLWIVLGINSGAYNTNAVISRSIDARESMDQDAIIKFYEPGGYPLAKLTAQDFTRINDARELVELEAGKKHAGELFVCPREGWASIYQDCRIRRVSFSFSEATLQINRLIVEVGERLQKQASDAEFAARRPPGDPADDPRVVAQIRPLIKQGPFKNDRLSKVRFLDSTWRIVRHSDTGILLGRRRKASISFERSDGQGCYYVSASYTQEHDGKDFVRDYLVQSDVSSNTNIPCENR